MPVLKLVLQLIFLTLLTTTLKIKAKTLLKYILLWNAIAVLCLLYQKEVELSHIILLFNVKTVFYYINMVLYCIKMFNYYMMIMFYYIRIMLLYMILLFEIMLFFYEWAFLSDSPFWMMVGFYVMKCVYMMTLLMRRCFFLCNNTFLYEGATCMKVLF